MAGPHKVLEQTLIPTEPIGQYHAIAQTDAEQGATPAVGGLVFGIVQEAIEQVDVDEGRAVAVRNIGSSFAVVSAPLAIGAAVAADADGRVRTAVVGDYIFGRCTTAGPLENDYAVVMFTFEGILAA